MCVSGTTKVSTLDGKERSLAELARLGGSHVAYACTPTGKVITAYCSVKPSSRITPTTTVRLDNHEHLRVASKQQLLDRGGSYVAAGKLRRHVSLMPLYRQRDKDGYILVQQNYSGRWQKAHWIVARSGQLGRVPKFEGQRTVIHHRNFDPADNSPPNLGFMGANDHSAFHRSLVERNQHWRSPEFERRRVEALHRKALTPEGHEYFAQRGTKNILGYMKQRPEHFRQSVAGNGERGAGYLDSYNRSERGRAKSRELANTLYSCDTCGEKVKSYIGLHNHRRWRHGYNHKVSSVRRGGATKDLYCVSMSGAENFGTTAGIFLKACGVRTE
jgi:tRNA-splicing ligase RtcB (3'-phosphate/5'-hydroxy nucleic acid ligase)